ncbi:MAG: hypothetical protein KDI68_15670 [Gammaproteobacteria bacterium]|nr:hypothetical protein [Gammaproteobacteria bacterium]
MIRWRALLAGSAVVVPLVLLLQLLFVSMLVGQKMAHGSYPKLDVVIGVVPYMIGFGGYMLIMLLGGYVTAAVATSRVVAHALAVAAFATGLSLWTSISLGGVKPMTLLFFLAALVCAAAGARLWRRRDNRRKQV